MVNGMGILKVLEYAQITGIERFVFSSSGCGVYGLESKMTFKEDIIKQNERINEIYDRETEKGTYEDWLKKHSQFKGKKNNG